MERIDLSKKQLRDFGVTMASCFFIIALLVWLKHRAFNPVLFSLSLVFLGAAFFCPSVLKYVYGPWMRLAEVMGALMSRVILTVLFIFVLIPISLLLRLMRKDPLNKGFVPGCRTYWNKVAVENKDYERQF